ncbi:DUF664 domain-containing protein [Pseudonocardia xinjiangensis]|uniref:mycothiol transferase n=1 Tax=Pseudonocardia xinjiangensis TaxID=75289 RepID=UPI003D8C64DF
MIIEDGPEEPLLGGDVTEGVVRVGNTVRRPRQPGSDLVEALLTHLERVGFDGAPRFLGIDARGRHALSYVSGEAAGRPWPAWVADDERIAGVARLVRRYDDAAQSFGIPEIAWAGTQPDPPGTPPSIAGPPSFVGHMDITPENVVFRDGHAAALIDFDLARPTDRVGEVCTMLRWWAPLMPVADREAAVRDVDAVARAALLVDEYGLDPIERRQVVAVARNSADRSWFLMRDRARRLGGGWQRMWEQGIGDRILRQQEWLAENATTLHDAVTHHRPRSVRRPLASGSRFAEGHASVDDEKRALLEFLAWQRASVLAIIDGLDEEALMTSVLPSGWTPLGLVEHLGHAERHWFQEIATGSADPLPWPDDNTPLITPRPPSVVLEFYRDQCARSDAIVAALPLPSPPRARHPDYLGDQITDLRGVILHMIEETARHAGHLDIVRELIDGKTGLGPR